MRPTPCRGIAKLRGPALDEVRETLLRAGVEGFYPAFDAWFRNRVIPGVASEERFCLGAFSRRALVGVAIGKACDRERKLCTLWVHPSHRRRGIGGALGTAAFERLGTRFPVFTIPEETLAEFTGLLRRWDFRPSAVETDLHRPGSREHSFNVSCV